MYREGTDVKAPWFLAALTYVGAVVGAGFASGQEILRFFSRYGHNGMLGIVLVGFSFAGLGYLALERGRGGDISSFGDLLESLYPPWLVRVAEGVTTAFLVVGLGVVASGGGSAIGQLGHTSRLFGAIITMGLIMAVTAWGSSAVTRANAVLVPYLIVMVCALAVVNWFKPPGHPGLTEPGSVWLLSAFLYLSYNIFTGIVVLLGLGRTLRSRKQSVLAAILGAAILVLLALMEHHTLVRLEDPGPLPLVDVAIKTHLVWGMLFAGCLWVALFTTGIAEAYALYTQYGSRTLWLVAATGLFGLLGFDRLVQALYPAMGLVAVWLWIPLVYRRPRSRVPGG